MSQGQETDSQKTGEGSVLGFFFLKTCIYQIMIAARFCFLSFFLFNLEKCSHNQVAYEAYEVLF